jgi:hypothetical protein
MNQLIIKFINDVIRQFQFQQNLDRALNDLSPGCDIDTWASVHSEVIANITKRQINERTFIEIELV